MTDAYHCNGLSPTYLMTVYFFHELFWRYNDGNLKSTIYHGPNIICPLPVRRSCDFDIYIKQVVTV